MNAKTKSFLLGFALSLIGVAGFFAWKHLGIQGGVLADSPNGEYLVVASGPMSPTSGGTYRIALRERLSTRVIQSATVTLASSEKTAALRGGGGEIIWDKDSAFADLFVADKPVMRIWVPAKDSN